MSFRYPVFLDLTDVPVLLVGAGPVAFRKAEGLVAAGAALTVVAPDLTPSFDTLACTIEQRRYEPGEAANYKLVMTATNDPAVNQQVAAEATAAGVWVNSADDPANCTFILPAIARQGTITVAVSSNGASPALASHLRTVIAHDVLTDAVGAAAIDLAQQRAEFHERGESTESIDWSERVARALDSARLTR